jgi:hypothetical protein
VSQVRSLRGPTSAHACDRARELRLASHLHSCLRTQCVIARLDRRAQARLLDAGLPAFSGYIDQLMSAGQSARGYLLFQGGAPVAYLFTPVADGIATYKYVQA